MTEKNEHFDVLLALLNPDSVWKSPSVSEEPEVQLMEWAIKQDTAGNRYFVGTEVCSGLGRVSTPIVEFDAGRHCGRTQSGRIYQLLGPPGRSGNGEYIWSVHKFSNGIKEVEK